MRASKRCPDPDCRGTTEPEQDGDVVYDECTTCGYALNWRRVEDPAENDGRCAVGVPDDVRRVASGFAAQPPLLQIGRFDARAQGR